MGNQMQKDMKDNELQTSYTFEIDNFSELKSSVNSPKFLSGGCEWFVTVSPKEYDFDDHMHLFLHVQSPNSLRTGWKRRANHRFSLLNQSGKVMYHGTEFTNMFCAQFSNWGQKTLPLEKLKAEGFLEKNKLIIKVEVKVVEVIHSSVVTGKEMFNFKGFEVPYTQVFSVSRLFKKHPDIALDFKPKTKEVKTAYMNLLLNLLEKLRKTPQSFSEIELSNAHDELSELTEAGFKLDWLKQKLEDISLERNNAIANASRLKEKEELIKKMELTLSDLKTEVKNEKEKSASAAARVLSFMDVI